MSPSTLRRVILPSCGIMAGIASSPPGQKNENPNLVHLIPTDILQSPRVLFHGVTSLDSVTPFAAMNAMPSGSTCVWTFNSFAFLLEMRSCPHPVSRINLLAFYVWIFCVSPSSVRTVRFWNKPWWSFGCRSAHVSQVSRLEGPNSEPWHVQNPSILESGIAPFIAQKQGTRLSNFRRWICSDIPLRHVLVNTVAWELPYLHSLRDLHLVIFSNLQVWFLQDQKDQM